MISSGGVVSERCAVAKVLSGAKPTSSDLSRFDGQLRREDDDVAAAEDQRNGHLIA
jgi:hypothetical protein